MHPVTSPSRRYDFGFPLLDTLVRVEDRPEGALVRASRNTFSERQKEQFVGWLAAEGFIPDEYRWFPIGQARGVRWVIDISWIELPPSLFQRARRCLGWLFSRRKSKLGA
jgi:hypothetical protein